MGRAKKEEQQQKPKSSMLGSGSAAKAGKAIESYKEKQQKALAEAMKD